jgi:hypothetical protein
MKSLRVNRDEILIAIILSLLTIGLTFFLAEKNVLNFFAIILAIITIIYLVFVFFDKRKKYFYLETSNSILMGVFILLGVWNPFFLVIGYFYHGVWDILHIKKIHTKIPRWYPLFCSIYDWILGGYIIFYLLK